MTKYACRRKFVRVCYIGKLYDLFVRLNFLRDIHSEYLVSSLLGLIQEYRNKTQSFLCTLSSKLIIDMLIGGNFCLTSALLYPC